MTLEFWILPDGPLPYTKKGSAVPGSKGLGLVRSPFYCGFDIGNPAKRLLTLELWSHTEGINNASRVDRSDELLTVVPNSKCKLIRRAWTAPTHYSVPEQQLHASAGQSIIHREVADDFQCLIRQSFKVYTVSTKHIAIGECQNRAFQWVELLSKKQHSFGKHGIAIARRKTL